MNLGGEKGYKYTFFICQLKVIFSMEVIFSITSSIMKSVDTFLFKKISLEMFSTPLSIFLSYYLCYFPMAAVA